MKRIYISIFFIFYFSLFSSVTAQKTGDEDYYASLKRGWQYMQQVYQQLNQHYVEEINPYPLMKAGIEGMLDQLDPYTVFLEEDGERRLNMITTGKYGGLGMEIGLRNQQITVIAPIDDSPASRMGIQAGDIIKKIDDKSVKGWSIDKVSRTLRGKIGTKVTLLIQRPGLSTPFELTLTRAEIILKDVSFAGFVSPGIAYVSLDGFTDKAPREVKEAIEKMQQEQTIRAFVLDLRGNPGGLLESAVQIVNFFVPRGKVVVSTRGYREKEFVFKTSNDPILPKVPLAILVNGGSASASEIVAGSLQDMDRAVIIGQPTFGKGLVQKVYTIDKHRDVKLKITTAKYYIPSGRCIQKRDYGLNNKVLIHDSLTMHPDSAHIFYTTLHKRPVKDRGGIYPDVTVTGDSVGYVLMQLIRKSMFFDFAVQFHREHPKWAQPLVVTDSIFNSFNDFINKRHFVYKLEAGRELDKIKSLASERGYADQIAPLIDRLKETFRAEQAKEIEKSKPSIRKYLRLELVSKYVSKSERERIALQTDKQLKKALEILQNSDQYQKILNP